MRRWWTCILAMVAASLAAGLVACSSSTATETQSGAGTPVEAGPTASPVRSVTSSPSAASPSIFPGLSSATSVRPTSTPAAPAPTVTPSPTIAPTATPVPPAAAFTASVERGPAPLTVAFTNASRNAASFIWDFGDGATSRDASPRHTYTKAGRYSIRLVARSTATGEIVADIAERSDMIDVRPGPLASLVIQPGQAQVQPRGDVELKASAADAYDNPIADLALTWKAAAAAGEIDGAGHFKAGTTAGEYPDAIIVKGVSGGASRQITIPVSIVPGPLASLTLTPAQLQLEPRGVAQLQARGADAFGNPLDGLPLTWAVSPGAGVMEGSGRFIAGTRAGQYPRAVTVAGPPGGKPVQAVLDVTVLPGPMASVSVRPAAASLFTGDTTTLVAEAVDGFGNPVPTRTVQWSAGTGKVQGLGLSATFTAGRSAEPAAITASVSDGRSTVAGTATLQVGQGYCDTKRVGAAWDTEWWRLNADLTLGASLGKVQVPRLSADWGDGPLFAGVRDPVLMRATTTIVVRRQGQVLITLGAADGYRLAVDGREIPALTDWTDHPYREASAYVPLEPGIYSLEIDYYHHAGQARLKFDIDADVTAWDEVSRCFGAYARIPEQRYVVYRANQAPDPTAVSAVADRFGLAASAVKYAPSSNLMMVPGKKPAPRKVIVLQGIDSEASCGDFTGGMDTPYYRLVSIAHAAQMDAWRDTGDVGALDERDFLAFSYADRYRSFGDSSGACAMARPIGAAQLASGTGFYADYSRVDTCIGAVAASDRLAALMGRILQFEPNTRFDLIGHSFGGTVIAEFAARSRPEFWTASMRSAVMIDAPLFGQPIGGVIFGYFVACGGSTPSIQDIAGRASVAGFPPVADMVRSISDPAIAGKLFTMRSSFAGDILVTSQFAFADCYSGSILAFPVAHSCVWDDANDIASISRVLGRGSAAIERNEVLQGWSRVAARIDDMGGIPRNAAAGTSGTGSFTFTNAGTTAWDFTANLEVRNGNDVVSESRIVTVPAGASSTITIPVAWGIPGARDVRVTLWADSFLKTQLADSGWLVAYTNVQTAAGP